MRLVPATSSTFGKTLSQRIPFLRDLVSNLILHEQIITTRAKAAAIAPIAEMIIRNAKSNTLESRKEIELWTVQHDKIMPLIFGPLRDRYLARPHGFTRTYNVLHSSYRHVPMSVIEFVHGPKDTLSLLEKYRAELETLKTKKESLGLWDMVSDQTEEEKKRLETSDVKDFIVPVEKMLQVIETHPRGRLHKMHAKKKDLVKQQDEILRLAGRAKCRHIMERFAKYRMGDSSVINAKEPQFWVK